jgi:AcrR family transcriptional regulator
MKSAKSIAKPAAKTAPRRSVAPAPYHHGNLRQALVEAGLALLEAAPAGERGEFSLRELARQVGVSANACYRHFADKEALLVALAAEGFRRMGAAQASAAAAEREPMDQHCAAGGAYVRFARDNPALFRLMFGRFASSHYNAELRQAGNAAFEALRSGAAQVLGLEAGDARVTVAAIRSWSLVHGLSQLMLDGQFEKHAENLEALVEAILRPEPSATGKATAKKTGKKLADQA